jgi:hypothetical protein
MTVTFATLLLVATFSSFFSVFVLTLLLVASLFVACASLFDALAFLAKDVALL